MGDNDKTVFGVTAAPFRLSVDLGSEDKARYGLDVKLQLMKETPQGKSDGGYLSYYAEWPIREERGGLPTHHASGGYSWKTDRGTIKFRGAGIARWIGDFGFYVERSPERLALGIQDTVGVEFRVFEKNGHELTITTCLELNLPLAEQERDEALGWSRLIPKFAAIFAISWSTRKVDAPAPATPTAPSGNPGDL